MKNKYYMSAGLCTVLLLSVFLLSSCGCKHENAEYLNAAEATCQTEGYTGDRFCNECKEIVSVGEVIPMLEHEVKTVGQIEATCQNDGHTGDDICVLCNKLLAKGVITAALPHEWLPVGNEVEATHLSAGYTGDSTCKKCQTLQNGQSIPMVEHTFVNHYCEECEWKEPGLYVNWEFTLSWGELEDLGYVTVEDGTLKSLQGNFQDGTLVIGEDVTCITTGVRSQGINNETIRNVYIPRTVTKLERSLLSFNESVETVSLFCQLTELESGTFLDSKNLRYVYLPDTLTYIGEMCFKGCDELGSIELPAGITEIGAYAFKDSAIDSILLPEGVTSIGEKAFAGTPLNGIVLPSTLEQCANAVFEGCTELQTVNFCECKKLTALESNMFYGCTSLKSVKLPQNLKSIGHMCFSNTPMIGIDLPDGLTDINDNAFLNSSVKQAVIPKSLITLGGLAECDLQMIRYKGSESLWKMSTGAEIFPKADIVYDYTPNPGLVMTGGTLLSDAVREEIPSFILEAVCAYYDLLDPKDITEEMLDGVKSLQIMYMSRILKDENLNYELEYAPEYYNYSVYAYVNGSPFGVWGPYIGTNRYEDLYMRKLQADNWQREKFDSFYTAYDPDNIYLEVDKVQELLKQYPSAAKYGGYYVCDPEIKARELREVRTIVMAMVFTDDRYVSEREIDLSSLKYFKNITEVEYCMDDSIEGASAEELEEYKYKYGLTFKNSPVDIIETYKSFADFYEE